MGLSYGFFDAELDAQGKYDRAYTAEQFAEYFGLIVSNGVFPNPSTQLQVVANTTPDMSVKINEGYGWINGYFAKNDGPYTLSIQTASGSLKRIDAIVLRWVKETRSMELAVKEGTASSSPVAPFPTRDDNLHELVLAHIAISAGATKITQSMITDTRTDASLCGIVTGAVQNIDASTLFAQYDTAFQEWFENLKAQLGGNVAANLQEQINERVKISDKATIEDVKSGLNDSRWMTPKLTKEMVDAIAYGIGDIKESARNLELLSDGKYVLCDGRTLVPSVYPELDSALKGRYGYVPSFEDALKLYSQKRADHSSYLLASGKDSNGIITALTLEGSSDSRFEVTRINPDNSIAGAYGFPTSENLVGMFHCGETCYVIAQGDNSVSLYSLSNSSANKLWTLSIYSASWFLGRYIVGTTAYAAFVYRTASTGVFSIGVLKVTGDSVAFYSIPTELYTADMYGFVLGDTVYFDKFQTKLTDISVSEIVDPSVTAFIHYMKTDSYSSYMHTPRAISEDGLLCGVVGRSAVVTISQGDSLEYRVYPIVNFRNGQKGSSMAGDTGGLYARLAFIGKTPWLAFDTGSSYPYVGIAVDGVMVMTDYISNVEFGFHEFANFYGEDGPLVALTYTNKTTSGNYTYTDRNVARLTYNGGGFKIPNLISESGGPTGLPVAYIKAKI